VAGVLAVINHPAFGVMSSLPGCRPVRQFTIFLMMTGAVSEQFYGDPLPRAKCPLEASHKAPWKGYR
jgi:hypothetical protein